jgi:hypothetical protein
MDNIKKLHRLHKFLMWIENDLPLIEGDFKRWVEFNTQNSVLFKANDLDQWYKNANTRDDKFESSYNLDLNKMIANVESSYNNLLELC